MSNKFLTTSEPLPSQASAQWANGAPSYTCETSEYFFFHHVKKRMDAYESAAKNISNGDVAGVFPFKKFFHLEDDSAAMTVDDARTRFNEIKAVFDELITVRPDVVVWPDLFISDTAFHGLLILSRVMSASS